MKVGDLVQSTNDSTIGVILDLGHRYWDGISMSFAHVQVSWHPCDGKASWIMTNQLRVV